MKRCSECHLNQAEFVMSNASGIHYLCGKCYPFKNKPVDVASSFQPNPFLSPPPLSQEAKERMILESMWVKPSAVHGR